MKLVSFNIQNYRSIVHSGWKNLAYDNVTVLIGQNESGKTSVLEALKSFYDGVINEDVLRSDLSLPVVHCKFSINNKRLSDFVNESQVDHELYQIMSKSTDFCLTRKWTEDRGSILYISSDEILDYFEVRELEKAKIEEETHGEIGKILRQSDKIFEDLKSAEQAKINSQKKLTEGRKLLEEKKKNLKRSKKPDFKLIAEKELESAQLNYSTLEEDFKTKLEAFEELKRKAENLSERVAICNSYEKSVENLKIITEDLNLSKRKYKESQHILDISVTEKERKKAQMRLDQAKDAYLNFENEHKKAEFKCELDKIAASKVLKGQSYNQAIKEAEKQLKTETSCLNMYQIGNLLFKHIPVFEFFEDFSSLLPNKIDLDDVLTGNSQVEGYKAAQNFLKIAGLTAEFFWEKNHRILKQKIENLNGEISINFQDYWSQNVGEDNKIKLNFELEHYDYTHPEKSGKPYLEFWIKDKTERLYPKQRSRGVRWFLSFYLELKAAASDKETNRVLLIDEPGLSLHAKAQEDVLKVFEDLKKNMQIVYCTHSSHLVDVEKLYRILAVQRAIEDDDTSESIIFDSNTLPNATTDTLTPIYSLMGIRLSDQQFIHPSNNFIVEDAVTYYYLMALYRTLKLPIDLYFIPASGLSNIYSLVNIFTGWKIGFNLLLFNSPKIEKTAEEIRKTTIIESNEKQTDKILIVKEFSYVEDVFSTLDFKKYILKQRIGITEKNSDYIINNNLSRTILASGFINEIRDQKLSLNRFDEETQTNINILFDVIKKNQT